MPECPSSRLRRRARSLDVARGGMLKGANSAIGTVELARSVSTMGFIDPIDLPVREPRPGFHGRFFHSEHMTFAYYTIAAGASVHRHHHPNDEVWHILQGELEVTLGETVRLLHAGQAAVVPPNLEHSARAVTDCRAIVVDHPIRASIGGVDIR